MSIQKIRYFMAIVNNDYNMTNTAENIHISQPALSQLIRSFEQEMKGPLFTKRKGRLIGLTPLGEAVYKKSLKIDRAYSELETLVENVKFGYSGSIVLGIPSFLLSSLYTSLLPKLINDNPFIEFKVKEMNTLMVKDHLINDLIDIGVMIEPTYLNQDEYITKEITTQSYYAYMAKDNPLSQLEEITWEMLASEPLALTNQGFITTSLIFDKFRSKKLNPTVKLQAETWDYLLNVCKISDLVTILPYIDDSKYASSDIAKVKILDTITWTAVISMSKKKESSLVNKSIFTSLSNIQ